MGVVVSEVGCLCPWEGCWEQWSPTVPSGPGLFLLSAPGFPLICSDPGAKEGHLQCICSPRQPGWPGSESELEQVKSSLEEGCWSFWGRAASPALITRTEEMGLGLPDPISWSSSCGDDSVSQKTL